MKLLNIQISIFITFIIRKIKLNAVAKLFRQALKEIKNLIKLPVELLEKTAKLFG